jgi:hypothetical protein
MKLKDNHILNAGEIAYIVTEESTRYPDIFAEFYTTLDEANASAEDAWKHLTKGEKQHKHIRVGVIKAEECEGGEVCLYGDIWSADDAFDSAEED